MNEQPSRSVDVPAAPEGVEGRAERVRRVEGELRQVREVLRWALEELRGVSPANLHLLRPGDFVTLKRRMRAVLRALGEGFVLSGQQPPAPTYGAEIDRFSAARMTMFLTKLQEQGAEDLGRHGVVTMIRGFDAFAALGLYFRAMEVLRVAVWFERAAAQGAPLSGTFAAVQPPPDPVRLHDTPPPMQRVERFPAPAADAPPPPDLQVCDVDRELSFADIGEALRSDCDVRAQLPAQRNGRR